MMRRRMMRPGMGVVGAVATTAAVVGTANAVSHKQQQKYANQAAEQQNAAQQAAQTDANAQQMAEMQQQMAQMQAQQAATAVPAAAGDDMMTKLTQLSTLHSQGVLTDEEFSAAKAKLLAGG